VTGEVGVASILTTSPQDIEAGSALDKKKLGSCWELKDRPASFPMPEFGFSKDAA
jgi:hypothetical protein